MTTSRKAEEIVIITGASSGIGGATARELARMGFYVLAEVRRNQDADAIREQSIEPHVLDITNPDYVQALAVRALINNAGMGANAPFEVFPIDEWRRLFEVNFFGHIMPDAGTSACPNPQQGSRDQHQLGGRKIAMATYGPYAGTKFALEAVTEAAQLACSLVEK